MFFLSPIFLEKLKEIQRRQNYVEPKAMAIVILVKIKKLMQQCFPHTFS